MAKRSPFSVEVQQDWQGLVRCIRREGTPERVHVIELFLDAEVQQAICERFGLIEDVSPEDPLFLRKRDLTVQRFLGYDYVRFGLDDLTFELSHTTIPDTAALKKEGGRSFINEHAGPITTWEEFDAFPWPDPAAASTRSLEWYSENLPEDMCIIGSGGFAHFA